MGQLGYVYNFHPEEIIATIGCTEAFNQSPRVVTSVGDTIAVESALRTLGQLALDIAAEPVSRISSEKIG